MQHTLWSLMGSKKEEKRKRRCKDLCNFSFLYDFREEKERIEDNSSPFYVRKTGKDSVPIAKSWGAIYERKNGFNSSRSKLARGVVV